MKFIKKNLDVESKQLFKNSSWVFFSNFTGIALNVLRSIIIARGLGAKTFGTYAIVVAFVGIIQEFLNLNLGTAIVKFGALYRKEERTDKLSALIRLSLKVSGIMVLVSIAVVALCTFISYATFADKAGLELYIILYGVAASTKYFNSVSSGVLRLYYKFRMNSIIQIIMDIVETGTIVTVVLVCPRNLDAFFITVIIATFLNGIICNLMAYWELRHELGSFLKAKYDLIREDIKSVKTFVIGNSLGNSLKSVMAQGDVLVLGALAGPAQVAFYSVAKKIGYAILALTDPLVQSIFPQFSKLLAEKKFPETRRMLRKITLMATYPCIIYVIVTLSMKEWIFVTVFGKEFLGSAEPFFYLLLSAVFSAITFWSLPLITSLGMVKLRIQVYMIAIVAGLTIAYFAIPHMLASGAALALLCMNLIINFIFIFKAFRKMDESPNNTLS